jgi:hypothetical protein
MYWASKQPPVFLHVGALDTVLAARRLSIIAAGRDAEPQFWSRPPGTIAAKDLALLLLMGE